MHPILESNIFRVFPNRNHCIPFGLHNFLKFLTGIHRLPKKPDFKPKLLFTRHFKKIQNCQKFGNLFILELTTFGANPLKIVLHIILFSETTIKMTKWSLIESQVTIYSNIYLYFSLNLCRSMDPDRVSLLHC